MMYLIGPYARIVWIPEDECGCVYACVCVCVWSTLSYEDEG